jgi:DNA polymerase-3 subunit epsilon
VTPWWESRLLGFDTETSGVDVETERIVTASLVLVEADDTVVESHAWLINPGVPIAEQATAVHGVTNERAQAEGMPASQGIATLATALRNLHAEGYPIAGFNLAFDLTLLDRECRRYGIESVVPNPVIDGYVLDKQADHYRKGKRTLSVTCEHYGVPLGDDAHDAAADALAAVRLARAIGRREPHPPADAAVLHQGQIVWRRQQQESLRAYFEAQGRDASDVDGTWPVRPVREAVASRG